MTTTSHSSLDRWTLFAAAVGLVVWTDGERLWVGEDGRRG